ncbi:hypothetical protein B0H13DRAFT_2328033 [Mycena leptocephala]|nr:hypothetical protein B0H13DRAFT_2328033 [Mycena leptocephala]
MSDADNIPYTTLAFHKKLKAELQAIASALGLNSDQYVSEHRKDITKYMDAHPELAHVPKFGPLFHRPQPKLAVKNSADKSSEEAAEVQLKDGVITGCVKFN